MLVRSSNEASATSILVDGGRRHTYAGWRPCLERALPLPAPLDLLVVSHIDADHIGGILAMLEGRGGDMRPIRSVWFNSHEQVRAAKAALSGLEAFGVAQGDRLTSVLAARGITCNKEFSEGRACVTADGGAPTLTIGDFEIHCLSPDDERLAALDPLWTAQLAKAGMLPGIDEPPPPPGLERFGAPDLVVEDLALFDGPQDRAVQNGSSIAFIAAARSRRVMLLADAHPDVVVGSLRRISPGGPIPVDLIKVSHHGSRSNISRELLDMVDCNRFAFSTDGSRRPHPNRETVALILKSKPGRKTLYFNYRQEHTEIWDDARLQAEYNFEAIFPPAEPGYLSIDI